MYSFQSTNGTFHRTRENNSKVCKESQSPQIAKTILIKNKGGGIMLSNIKLYILHSMIIKHYGIVTRNGHIDQSNRTESPEISLRILISHASTVMLKILQATLQQYVNHELPDVQAGFRRGRRTRDQIANICWIMEKAREFQKKNIYFSFIDYAKAFDCVDHNKLWKILKRWEYQTT